MADEECRSTTEIRGVAMARRRNGGVRVVIDGVVDVRERRLSRIEGLREKMKGRGRGCGLKGERRGKREI